MERNISHTERGQHREENLLKCVTSETAHRNNRVGKEICASPIHRSRAFSIHGGSPRRTEHSDNAKNSRRTSLPTSDLNLIDNFLAVPKSVMYDFSEISELPNSDERVRRVKSFREKREKKGENLRRVRSFKTTSKGLVNRGDSFKKNKSIHSGSAYISDEDTLEQDHVVDNILCGGESKIPVVKTSDEQTTNYFRVLMLGGPGVGKTSLIDQFMTSEFLGSGDYNISQSEEENTVTLQVDGDESTLEFIQSEDFQDRLLTFDIDAYIVVYSITDKTSFLQAIDILKQLREEVGPNKAIILASNKSDLVRKRIIGTDEGRATADKYGGKYIEISAALNHRVDELLVGTLKQILIKVNTVSSDVDETGEMLNMPVKRRQSSFKKTKHFLEKLFRGNSTKDNTTENLYVD